MVVFLIIIGSIYGLLQTGRLDRNRSSRRADIMKNARAAIHLIGRDALNAGLSYHKTGGIVPDNFISNTLSLTPDTDAKRDTLTSVIAGNNIFPNNLNEDPNVRTDVVSIIYRDLDFNGGDNITINNVAGAGGGNTARLRTPAGQAAAVNNYDLYLIESNSSQAVVMVTSKVDNSTLDVAPNDPLGINQAYNGTGNNRSLLKACTTTIVVDCTTYNTTDPNATIPIATMKKIIWVSYKVKPDGTLVRTLYGNNNGQPADQQIQEQPLAYNVKNLQFRYVLLDGSVTDNPSPSQFNLIRQITITIQVASTEIDEQTHKPDVITLNATFSFRNLDYDAG